MKKNKLISLLFILLIGISCTDQLRKDQLEQAENVDRMTSARYLLAGSIVRITTYYQEEAFTEDNYLAIMEYYQQLFSVKAQSYEEFTKAPGNWGHEFDLLYDTKAGIDVAMSEGLPSTAAAQKILQAFMFELLTNIYGDIPFSEALKGREGIVKPIYDPQQDIYEGLLKMLDDAVATLKSSSDVIDPEQDLLYEGSKEGWIRLANSIEVRLLVNSYEAFGGSKKADLETASKSLLIDDNVWNASMAYVGSNDDDSWYFGRTGDDNELTRRKPSVTFIKAMKSNNDPRLFAWVSPATTPWSDTITSGVDYVPTVVEDYYGNEFTINIRNTESADNPDIYKDYPLNEIYVGAPLMANSAIKVIWGDESGDAYQNWKMSDWNPNIFLQRSHPLFPATLMEASEVMFNLAEAAQRGWISGNASDFYEKAVRLNMERWEIKDADIAKYLQANGLPSGGTEALKVIYTERWKSLFIQGTQAWFYYRRTQWPEMGAIERNAYPFPLRWRYPTYEADNNSENVDEAVKRSLGGKDTQDAKMWILNNVTPVQ
jgi:hypothetical protein